MSDKATCAVCDATNSSLVEVIRDGGVCPYCGVGTDGMQEVRRLEHQSRAVVLERYKQAMRELAKAREELAESRRVVTAVRMAVGDRP